MAEITQRITELPASIIIDNAYSFFVNDNGAAKQCSKEILKNYLGIDLTAEEITALGNLSVVSTGTKFFSDIANGGGYRNILWSDITNIPLGFTSFNADEFEVNASKVLSVKDWHSHTNKATVLDKLSTTDSKLYFDSVEVGTSYTLPTASTTTLGGIKVDGTTITITDGIASGTATYSLPTASNTVLGGVKVDGTSISINDGVISTDRLSLDSLVESNGISITKDTELKTATFKLSIPIWVALTNYYVGNYVLNENKIYKCKTLHTSGATFIDTNWDMIGGSDGTKISDWVSGKSYILKDLVIYSNSIWQCTTANTDTAWTESNWNCVSTGADGINAYVWIKYSVNQPTQDSDMTNVPSNWIGFYSGANSTAPTTYTSYQWFNYKGSTGETGANGTDGTDGADGATWYNGTACTGNSTTPIVFTTGITSANINDYYINVTTNYYYQCTLGGADTVATWIYVGHFDGLTLNDTTISETTTYSSTKIESRLSDKQDKITISSTFTLTVAGWDSGTKTQKALISLNLINVNDIIYDLSCLDIIIASAVIPSLEETTGITFKCTTIPTSDITFSVKVTVI